MAKNSAFKQAQKRYVSFWRMGRIRSFIYGVFVFPVYLLSRVVRKKGHDLYGSFNGRAIGDNSWYAYNEDGIRPKYFITKSLDLVNKHRDLGTVVYCFSLRGLWLQLSAKNVFFSHTIDDFFAPAVVGSNVIALGHGIPMKKTAAVDKELAWIHNPIVRLIILNLFPYLYHYFCHEVHSPSSFFDSAKLAVYGYTKPKLVRSQMPRNSILNKKKKANNRFLFAPTFRRNQDFQTTLQSAGVYEAKLIDLLSQESIELWVKPHYLDRNSLDDLNLPDPIKIVQFEDINQAFSDFSHLITDYSSVSYDAAVAGLRIAFVNFDIDSYQKNESELFGWYLEIANKFGSESIHDAMTKLIRGDGAELSDFGTQGN